jgi:uncharacterized membrane protein
VTDPDPDRATTAVPRWPAILLGVGLGGLWDGIVLHQILQWHHMVSAPVPPTTLADLELNTLADGLFHGFAWIVTLIGAVLTWRTLPRRRPVRPGRVLLGGLLLGWGGFNLVEGLIDHQLLGLHHVRPGPDEVAWDLAYLAWGAAMAAAGWWLLGRERVQAPV